MDAVSRVAGAFAITCVTTAASAVEPPPYRAIVFDWEIGDGDINGGSVLTLSRWPSTDAGGDGLRFRFASDKLVVGTIAGSGADPEGLRAASWRIGEPGSRVVFDLPPYSMGTAVADANLDGTLVGAVLMPGPERHPVSIQAAAWTLLDGDPSGQPEFHLVFGPDGVADCDGNLPDTILSAVGPRTLEVDQPAMVAGIGGLAGQGGLPDGFLGGLTAEGTFSEVKRLPGIADADWCDTWTYSVEPRRSVGQCIAWGGVFPPDVWKSFWVVGLFRDTHTPIEAFCIDTQKWDLYSWTWTDQNFLIPSCRGCPSEWDPPAGQPFVPDCAHVSPEDSSVSFVTELRFSSFAPGDVGNGQPLALGGIVDVRAGADITFACGSTVCARAHAAVVLASGELAQDGVEMFDLHTVLPDGMASAFKASGIARIYPLETPGSDESTPVDWVAVGAFGQDFRSGDELNQRHGCIWLGQFTSMNSTDWCAFDINPLTIMPAEMNIEAIHDINPRGVAVGVASQEVSNIFYNRLVYLTEAADLNGDLVKDGGDLAALLGCWGSVAAACNFADLDRDGSVGGSDLALLIGAWHGGGPGGEVCMELTCQGSPWLSPLRRYPYIGMAANFLGFESLDALGDALLLLEPDSALGLCEVVDAVASAIEGAE